LLVRQDLLHLNCTLRRDLLRRSRGEGSVYKRKDGLWVARYEAAGKRKYLYGKTKKIVTDKFREMLSSGGANLAPDADGMRVDEYLDRWLPTVKGTVKERTWVRHEEVVRLHLKPSIGWVKLQKLNALDVSELYQAKSSEGLSHRTVQIIHTTLHKALKQAVRWSLIQKKVTEAVTPPRPERKEIRVLSSEESKRLLRAARGSRFEALYILAITTGMRQGELLGLKWEDVDLEEGVIRVRRTVWGGVATAPKTAKANRSICLTEMAREALKERKKCDGGSEWIFSSKNGTLIDCHNLINRSWWPLLKKAELPRIPMHNLRHTAATLLLSKGVHPKFVQELLGHADISATLNTYSHVIPSMRGETAWAMEKVLREGGKS
jgi:integrase